MPRYPSARRYAPGRVPDCVWNTTASTCGSTTCRRWQTCSKTAKSQHSWTRRRCRTPGSSKPFEELLGDSVGELPSNPAGSARDTKSMTQLGSRHPGAVQRHGRSRHRGIQWADVTTAVPLDDAQQKEVSQLLGGIVGSEVSLRTYVEPELIGGDHCEAGRPRHRWKRAQQVERICTGR